MSDPSSALSVWQLTLMAVVPTVLLFGWLIAIFIAAREPQGNAGGRESDPWATDGTDHE